MALESLYSFIDELQCRGLRRCMPDVWGGPGVDGQGLEKWKERPLREYTLVTTTVLEGDNTVLYDNTVLHDNTVLRDNIVLHDNNVLHDNTVPHDNTVLHDNNVIEQVAVRSGMDSKMAELFLDFGTCICKNSDYNE
ncbi:reverse transcriptase domain-containing protein [Tanacetum coccineum]